MTAQASAALASLNEALLMVKAELPAIVAEASPQQLQTSVDGWVGMALDLLNLRLGPDMAAAAVRRRVETWRAAK